MHGIQRLQREDQWNVSSAPSGHNYLPHFWKLVCDLAINIFVIALPHLGTVQRNCVFARRSGAAHAVRDLRARIRHGDHAAV